MNQVQLLISLPSQMAWRAEPPRGAGSQQPLTDAACPEGVQAPASPLARSLGFLSVAGRVLGAPSLGPTQCPGTQGTFSPGFPQPAASLHPARLQEALMPMGAGRQREVEDAAG